METTFQSNLASPAYQYDIEYCKSEQHADMLSRLHKPDETAGDEPSTYNVLCINDIPVSAINIATENISLLLKYVMPGWPNHVSDELYIANQVVHS